METVSYKSYQDMAKAILNSLHKIPHDIDAVVGVPRSGTLAAHMVALFLNKPVTDIDSFLRWGWVCRCGDRGKAYNEGPSVKKVLVVEDSVRSGKSINVARQRLGGSPYKAVFMGVFVSRGCADMVDISCSIVEPPRAFAWNIFHHPELLGRACMDIDGVLCRDPTDDENDDGSNYIRFISGVEPKIIPSVRVKTLVTCRLEKYRAATEIWLAGNNVQYGRLVMMNLPDAKTRRRLNQYGAFKANEFRKKDYLIFIESSEKEARDIKSRCPEKTVFCTSTMDVIRT